MSGRTTAPAVLLIAVTIGVGWSGTAGATRALAQSPTLERIDRLAGAGRVEEARTSLVEWWGSERTSASRVDEQRGLWLRARLTVDPEQAMLDYRRLVLLYPAGPFTDRSLLRLAQAAHALGDQAGARAYVAALVRDHPDAPARRAAEAWLATAGEASPPGAVTAAAPRAEPGRAEPGRATSVEAERPPTPASPVLRASTPELPTPGSVGTYSVQLGAFGDPSRARDVQERAVAAGLDARIVRVEGSDLLHVRLGSFTERPPAQEILDRITRLEIEGAVVRDPRPERALEGP
jgi:cell division septation protein DedD